jgi:hypothetical protein
MLTARDVPEQTAPKSRIELATKTILRKEAVPREATAEAAPGVQPEDRQVSSGTVRRRDAIPAEAEVRRAPDARDVGARVAGAVSPAAVAVIAPALSGRSALAESAAVETAAAIIPDLPSTRLSQADRPAASAATVAARPAEAPSRAADARAASVAATAALSLRLEAALPRAAPLPTTEPEAALSPAVADASRPAGPIEVSGSRFPPLSVEARAVAQSRPVQVAAPPAEVAAETVTALMEFSGGEQTALDPLGLRAVTAFVAPDSAGASGRELRSAIDGILSSVPCSRLQTSLDSDTGTVRLRGHIPDDAYRAILTGALQRHIGDALPVVDGLHLLKEPQCGILGQLDALGLPQSEEQFTDASLIGEDLFVREYAFNDGERMVLELEAADYPAFIYVDYFDASGNVLHLMPNEVLPLRRYQPGEPFAIGAAGSGIDLIVEAPFGQDIVIALASDKALYDELRPLSEPADEYLRFLRDRITEVAPERAEWVYLLVTTSAER